MSGAAVDVGGSVRVNLASTDVCAYRLPRGQAVTAGRASAAGIRLSPGWVPHRLARFEPVERGWHLANGDRTRVRVRNPRVVDAWFAQHAEVLLHRGTWELSWDALDHPCRMLVRVGDPRTTGADLPYAVDKSEQLSRARFQTLLAGREVQPNALLRHRLAVLYRHLILDLPAPVNLCKEAAERLGTSEQAIKNAANRYRERLNERRGHSIETLDDLGYYLVHVAGVLGPDDLEP